MTTKNIVRSYCRLVQACVCMSAALVTNSLVPDDSLRWQPFVVMFCIVIANLAGFIQGLNEGDNSGD